MFLKYSKACWYITCADIHCFDGVDKCVKNSLLCAQCVMHESELICFCCECVDSGPLHFAAQNGNIELLEALLNVEDVDINSQVMFAY